MQSKLFSTLFSISLLTFGLSAQASLEESEVELSTTGITQKGTASYYSDRFHGRRTASGERYDRNDLTAVHRHLPFGSIVRVTNLHNNRSIQLRINDRTRLPHGRVLDVSKRAAQELGFIGAGLAKVEIEVLR